jgi:hypothetical protein
MECAHQCNFLNRAVSLAPLPIHASTLIFSHLLHVLQVWIRSPGLCCTAFVIYTASLYSENTTCAEFPKVSIAIAALVVLNGQYYMQVSGIITETICMLLLLVYACRLWSATPSVKLRNTTARLAANLLEHVRVVQTAGFTCMCLV